MRAPLRTKAQKLKIQKSKDDLKARAKAYVKPKKPKNKPIKVFRK